MTIKYKMWILKKLNNGKKNLVPQGMGREGEWRHGEGGGELYREGEGSEWRERGLFFALFDFSKIHTLYFIVTSVFYSSSYVIIINTVSDISLTHIQVLIKLYGLTVLTKSNLRDHNLLF